VTPCRCERCCPDDPAPTYTRAHLIECLAREIASEPSLEARRARLASWEASHGKRWGKRVREAVKRIWSETHADT
jgi:hypothetical protein